MSLESIKNINVDCYDERYILINAKQYDGGSRYITVTCYNQGSIFNVSSSKHTAYVRCRKADGHTVFDFCTINTKGQIIIELTEQMLASTGVCDVDLVIINKGNAVVNVDTGEIITVDNSAVISTMVFRMYVYESAVDNSLIESSDDYSGLSDLLARAEASYEQVISSSEEWALNSQSWAIGGTGVEGRASVEDTDNSKYYSELSSDSADAAKKSQNAAKASEEAASASATSAASSKSAASTSETNAADSANIAKSYAVGGTETRDGEDTDNAEYYYKQSLENSNSASASATSAASSKSAASTSETNAAASAEAASASETNAANSASSASASALSASTSETKASEYCEQVKNVLDGLNSGFIPMGTVSFTELATVSKATGYVYNISEDFVTDDTFREGAGMPYTVGTNVYYTGDGFWDCFGGSASTTATVDEIKTYLGI